MLNPPPPDPSAGALESPYLNEEVLGTGTAELGHGENGALDQSPFARMEQIVAKPAPRQTGEVALRPHLVVVDENDKPLSGADYAFHQKGKASQKGKLTESGFAFFGEIDFKKPFVFEVLDRVCTIRVGAYLNPADAEIQYGGTSFDWTLVRDDKNADKNFWPYYQREMDFARDLEAYEVTQGRRVERFLQHEHITRRPITIAKPFLSKLSQVRIRATPVEIRVGPFVRYTDHGRAVIWFETVTPCMVRISYKAAGDPTPAVRHSSTFRVGGRYFAAVEIDGLKSETVYDYTFELAPLPGFGPIPNFEADFKAAFPVLTAAVKAAMQKQHVPASLDGKPRLNFRTLRPKYEKELRFATGSCRWYPGDTNHGKDWGPDMLAGLGDWLQLNSRDKWPQFLFFGGDQIYSDEIGDDTGSMLTKGRFASRLPGPVDPAQSARDKLVDGAWAGRFAHRYRAYKDPSTKLVQGLEKSLETLDRFYRLYPEIRDIAKYYPGKDRRRMLRGQKRAGEILGALDAIDKLEISSEPFRMFMPHWKAGFDIALRRNPMGRRFLSHNFLLWRLPAFEKDLPTIANFGGFTVARGPDLHGYPPPSRDGHAADFAEYAYLYERAWTTSRSVKRLLAHIPTFLMFDDHEVTDDWNFSAAWVRMLHNPKDSLKMWPKTMTDALAAYWVFQGYCNKAPSQWNSEDPRVKALSEARLQGTDALPTLRRAIYQACFHPPPKNDVRAPYQAGLSLDWHYKLPFEPAFLVPDCRTRRLMVPSDESIRVIDHDKRDARPLSQTIDGPDPRNPGKHEDQLTWIRKFVCDPADRPGTAPVMFLAPSTPLLLQKKAIQIMMAPELAAKAGIGVTDLLSIPAALFSSTALATGSDEQLLLFRRGSDLEHMVRDRSWTDLWAMVQAMHDKRGNRVKTLILVSGDVHHNYSMTANLPGGGRPRPELLQITSSGMQTTIRKDFPRSLAEELGSTSFNIGKYRLVPGFMSKNRTGEPDLVLFQNAVAMVHARFENEVNVRVEYFSRESRTARIDSHEFRYTSGAAYMRGSEPTFSPMNRRQSDVRSDLGALATNPRELESGFSSVDR
jgi:hypothetical protein